MWYLNKMFKVIFVTNKILLCWRSNISRKLWVNRIDFKFDFYNLLVYDNNKILNFLRYGFFIYKMGLYIYINLRIKLFFKMLSV